MSDDQHYDVIVIGTGAGGGTFAHRIAPSGKRVLLLERGDYLPRERDNWDSTAVFVKGTYRAPEFWLDRHGHEFPPEVNYYVGGNTKFYGAALFRLRPQDFGELRHHGGISPAWPIEYADLEPYYTQAEHLYVVHGRHGEDPTAGHASADYRYPPVQHEPRIQQLSDDLEKQGLHPFHLPIGVRLTQDAHGAATRDSVCIRCDRVDGFPCLLGGKADAQVICVDPALEHDNVRLVTRAHVMRLETDGGGRAVTAVVTEIERRRRRRGNGALQRRRRGGGRGRGELRGPAAALGERPAPQRPGQRLRRGRPALHAPQQPGPDGGVQGAEPDPVPEDPGPARLVPRLGRLGLPHGRDPDARQVRRRADPRQRPALGRGRITRDALRGAGPPRSRPSGSAARTFRCRRTGSPSRTTARSA